MMQRLYHMVTIPDGITDVKLAQLRTAIAVRWHAAAGEDTAALADPAVADDSAGWKGR